VIVFFRADHAARARVAAEIFPMRRVGIPGAKKAAPLKR
jgi:hypothetical protein